MAYESLIFFRITFAISIIITVSVPIPISIMTISFGCAVQDNSHVFISLICIKSFYFDVSAIRQTKVHKISKISPKNATISPVEISRPSPTHPNTFPQRKSLRHSFPELGNTAHQLRSTPIHVHNQNDRKGSQLGPPILII